MADIGLKCVQGNRREALPEFIYSSLIHQYGLKTLAKEHLGQLVNGVRKHAKDDENFNPRVKLFGQLSGILNEDLFSSATANFMLDFLRRLFVSSMIEESMNHDGCAVTLEQATEAVTEAFNSYSTSVPPGLMEEVEKMGKDATVAVEGGAPQTVTQVLFDPLFAAVYARWLDCMAESDRELLAVFEKFDADHDGSLSLTEFSTLVTAVDLGVDSAGAPFV